MEKKNNLSHIPLKDNNNLKPAKKLHFIMVNSKSPNSKIKIINNKSKSKSKSKYIIDNKIKILLKKKFLLQNNNNNNNIYIKKVNKNNQSQNDIINKQEEEQSNKKTSPPILKRNKSGFAHRKNNYIIYVSNTGLNSPNKTLNNIQGKLKFFKSFKNIIKDKNIKLIQKSTKIIPIKSKNNYLTKNNTHKSYKNIGIKIIGNNNNECSVLMTKIEENPDILKNNNYKGNITYNNNVNLNFNNNKDNNEILLDIPKRIYINNNEMEMGKKKFHSRSPSFNYPRIIHSISPLKIDEKRYHIKIVKKGNKLIKIPIIQNEKKKELADNYSYHEITHFKTPKKRINKNNIDKLYLNKNEKKNNYIIRNINQEIAQLFAKKRNNFGGKPNINLNNNQSFSNLNNRPLFYDMQMPYYPTISNKIQSFRNINTDEYYNCINSMNHSNNQKYFNSGLILSPNKYNIPNNERFIDNNNDNEEVNDLPQTIHYFGEQMLKRNNNYNILKNENDSYSYNYYLAKGKNNKNIKICLKTNKSNCNMTQRNYYNLNKLVQNLNKNSDKNINPNKIIEKMNIIKRNNRYSHNIINRKKMKKFVMEKSQNAEFISNSNKKEDKNEEIKDNINNNENSIIGNDSLKEIIQEFEKEIEEEEKREKINKKQKINNSNNDTLIFSYFSDNDYSILSKDSTNNSKNKIIKKHYYKTKNVDMEKNFDFMIQGVKKNKSVKK